MLGNRKIVGPVGKTLKQNGKPEWVDAAACVAIKTIPNVPLNAPLPYRLAFDQIGINFVRIYLK